MTQPQPEAPISETHETWNPIDVACPHCGASARISQVQGDRCPGCNFEFKRFGPGEAHVWEDFFQTLTRQKYRLGLGANGFLVAHE